VLLEHRDILICKDPVDAMALMQIGLKNVVALMGIYDFRKLHLEVLKQYGVRNICLLLGSDTTSSSLADFIADRIVENGIHAKIIDLHRASYRSEAMANLGLDEVLALINRAVAH